MKRPISEKKRAEYITYPRCPRCKKKNTKTDLNIIKRGSAYGYQRYRCKSCGFHFVPNASRRRGNKRKFLPMECLHCGSLNTYSNGVRHRVTTFPCRYIYCKDCKKQSVYPIDKSVVL